jgi:hypothetical protein
VTIRRSRSDSSSTVAVDSSRMSPNDGCCLRQVLRRLSIAIWIGVSGFLISWARRRAISCHAAIRSAITRRSSAVPRSSSIRLKAPASSPTSSAEVTATRCARSPRAAAWAPSTRSIEPGGDAPGHHRAQEHGQAQGQDRQHHRDHGDLALQRRQIAIADRDLDPRRDLLAVADQGDAGQRPALTVPPRLGRGHQLAAATVDDPGVDPTGPAHALDQARVDGAPDHHDHRDGRRPGPGARSRRSAPAASPARP